MSNYECQKGWILAPSLNGGDYVPFFINVRDKDIVWDDDNLSPELKRLANLGTDKKIIFTDSKWIFEYKNWMIELFNTGKYNAKRKINISEEFDDSTMTSTEIKAIIDLPFETVNDENFTAFITKSSSNIRIKSSMSGINNITDDIFTNIEVFLFNQQYNFPTDFKQTNVFDDSYLFINIEGNVNI